jgi:hypothetical protein
MSLGVIIPLRHMAAAVDALVHDLGINVRMSSYWKEQPSRRSARRVEGHKSDTTDKADNAPV